MSCQISERYVLCCFRLYQLCRKQCLRAMWMNKEKSDSISNPGSFLSRALIILYRLYVATFLKNNEMRAPSAECKVPVIECLLRQRCRFLFFVWQKREISLLVQKPICHYVNLFLPDKPSVTEVHVWRIYLQRNGPDLKVDAYAKRIKKTW